MLCLIVIAVAGLAGTEPPDERVREIQAMIEQLGHARFQAQEAAQKRLIELGDAARPYVAEVLESNLLEARVRAKRILDARGFEMYLLADPTIEAGHLSGKAPEGLGRLKLADRPIVADEDLFGYDLSTHALHLTEAAIDRIRSPRVDLLGRPFVVVADGRRCYLGAFWNSVSSALARVPTIIVDPIAPPGSAVMIGPRQYRLKGDSNDDPRGDERIVEALKRTGKLRRGLSYRLISGEIIDRSGTAAIRYTFEMTNLGKGRLLSLDPRKMPSSHQYHHFHIAALVNKDGKPVRRRSSKCERISLTLDWLTRLAPGQTMRRTTELDGFERLDEGPYTLGLQFSFRFARHHLPADKARELPVWVGKLDSNRIRIGPAATAPAQ